MTELPGEAFESLASSLNIDRFGLMLVADGSGSALTSPAGWYCAAYLRASRRIREYSGHVSAGTVNYAELYPFVHALWAISSAYASLKRDEPLSIDVVCVSDSEVTIKCGNGEYERKSNAPLWAAIESLEKSGFQLAWKWVPRNSNEVSKRADTVSKQMRTKC